MFRKIHVLAVLSLVASLGLLAPGASVEANEGSLREEIDAAAAEYDVPEDLLLAMGYVNTRWEMPPPNASDYEESEAKEGQPEARGNYGIMSLYDNPSRDTLGRASELTGRSKEELRTERAANIRGGAALLAELQAGEKPDDINGWYDAVSEYGDGTLYANQVYETLKNGASAEVSTGESIELTAHPGAEPRNLFSAQASADYGRATWYGTNGNNYTPANRGRAGIDKIVVHVTQGSFSGAINWFKNSQAQASAHYTVRSKDGFVGQSVREKNIAWHAGNWNYNKRSIGIEHEGYVSQPSWFTDKMYRSSARLTAHLAKKYRIGISRKNIIGHNQVPGATHTDPGQYWNWKKYMNYVKTYAGTNTRYKQIIDNTSPRFTASPNWKASSWSSQRYGKNYRYTSPKNKKEFAKFKVKIPKRARYNVFARWPANSGYNSRARFQVRTVNGWKTRVVSQRKRGGKWVKLGEFKMAGRDRVGVRIARRTSGKGYIIADAVMVKR